ncbi:hypothetical protein SY88_05375 [Clostridiales bacterium PH28_bin88]|nr:hypothetical protein SY88_05375 [Clostridiales bacterium PH28_bin88]
MLVWYRNETKGVLILRHPRARSRAVQRSQAGARPCAVRVMGIRPFMVGGPGMYFANILAKQLIKQVQAGGETMWLMAVAVQLVLAVILSYSVRALAAWRKRNSQII